MKKWFLIAVTLLLLSGAAMAQSWTGDVLGSHDLSPGNKSPIQGSGSGACLYCHAPHSGVGGKTPLWAQTLSTQNYGLYSSTGLKNTPQQPLLGSTSSLCLSCHDGTVAVGNKVPGGAIAMTGAMNVKDVFGTQLQSSHPFSLTTPLVDAAHLVSTLADTGITADPTHKVALINGTIECNSCHEPHRQNIDPVSLNFLAIDAVNGQLCLACHTSSARTVSGKSNRLAQWSTGAHAVSANPVNVSAGLGAYSTVGQFACGSCHEQHKANGGTGLLRAAVPPVVNVDPFTQSCITCHNGSTNLQNPIFNVYGNFSKPAAHPLPTGSNTHEPSEAVVPVNNRHATCADCHNPHSALQVASFGAAPAIRVSQTGVVGVSAADGTTVVNPAANQYESCLRCHGTSAGKQAVYGYLPLWAVSAADRLNLIPQFAPTATSSHPVLHASSSAWPQPSLRPFMLNLDGISNNPRSLSGAGTQLFCTDCHNADDNREFRGSGPNGPHGSQYSHILERRYEFSQVDPTAGPGTAIQNTFPNPSLNAGGGSPGPYAMCGKCHDLSQIMTLASFQLPGAKIGHQIHVDTQGVSCSVCHTGHGLGAMSASISGERLVNFDLNVVAANGGSPIAYNHATNTCTLTCHGKNHNADGTVTAMAPTTPVR